MVLALSYCPFSDIIHNNASLLFLTSWWGILTCQNQTFNITKPLIKKIFVGGGLRLHLRAHFSHHTNRVCTIKVVWLLIWHLYTFPRQDFSLGRKLNSNWILSQINQSILLFYFTWPQPISHLIMFSLLLISYCWQQGKELGEEKNSN